MHLVLSMPLPWREYDLIMVSAKLLLVNENADVVLAKRNNTIAWWHCEKKRTTDMVVIIAVGGYFGLLR